MWYKPVAGAVNVVDIPLQLNVNGWAIAVQCVNSAMAVSGK
jgi:hypothetical protein